MMGFTVCQDHVEFHPENSPQGVKGSIGAAGEGALEAVQASGGGGEKWVLRRIVPALAPIGGGTCSRLVAYAELREARKHGWFTSECLAWDLAERVSQSYLGVPELREAQTFGV